MYNIQLWFAREDNGDIVVAANASLSKNYICPICESVVVPKGTKDGSKVTPHFAHVDKSRCTSESMIHWWFKNKLIEVGDTFKVKEDKVSTYVASEISIENTYSVGELLYRPDLTITTKCGKKIHFEMAYTNSKKVDEYLGIWTKLGDTIVEVDIQNLMNSSNKNVFNAIFFREKLKDKRKRSSYKSNVESYINRKFKDDRNKEEIDRINRLNWLWFDLGRYMSGKISIDDLVISIDNIDDDDRDFVCDVLDRKTCQFVSDEVVAYKCKTIQDSLNRSNIECECIGSRINVKYDDSTTQSFLVNSYDTIDAIVNKVETLNKKHLLDVKISTEVEKIISLLNKYYDDVYLTYTRIGSPVRYMPKLFYKKYSNHEIECRMVDHNDRCNYSTYENISIETLYPNLEDAKINIGNKSITCNIFEIHKARKAIVRHFNKYIKREKESRNAKMWGGLPYETK